MKYIRSVFPLIIGLLLGAIGTFLYTNSLPPAKDSPEERISELEASLTKAENKVRAYEDASPRRSLRNTRDGMRSIAVAMRKGLPVTPDDIFHAAQPLMRDLSPINERFYAIRARERAESLAGEYARKYGLNAQQQKALIEHLTANAELDVRDHLAVLERDTTSTREFTKSLRELEESDHGIDSFMNQTLTGQKLSEYRADRYVQKAENVQQYADRRVYQISNIVDLTDTQRSQLFLYNARKSPNFDSQMQFEDLDPAAATMPNHASDNDALAYILTPEQRTRYANTVYERTQKAREEAARYGLTLPDDWDPLEEDF